MTTANKVRGWYMYERVTFAVTNPEQLKRVCDNCGGSDTACFSNTEMGQTAYRCRACDHVHKDELNGEDESDSTKGK